MLVAEIDEMHQVCMDELGEIRIGKVVSPLKEQDKSLVTTQHIKGIAKMKRHMRVEKRKRMIWRKIKACVNGQE